VQEAYEQWESELHFLVDESMDCPGQAEADERKKKLGKANQIGVKCHFLQGINATVYRV
jgi:hypothetical protein